MNSTIAKFKNFCQDNPIIISIAFVSVVIHFLVNAFTAYGIFRDELYYIACSKHLAFGYVDQPPLMAVILAVSNFIFGDSLFAIRIIPALCGAGIIIYTGLIVKELGGNKFAVTISTITVMLFPVHLSINNIYSMNCFDLLFWAIGFYILVRIFKSGNEKLWIKFGIVAGLGLQNKYSVMFLCFGIYTGILFTPLRKHYLSKWFWIGNIIALLIFIPHITWQIIYHWPSLEFIHNASVLKNTPVSFVGFVTGQIMMGNPVNILIWLTGLLYLLFAGDLKQFRVFAFGYIILFLLFVYQNGKSYYLSPYYPILIAAGGLAIEKLILYKNLQWLKPVLLSTIIIGGIIALPMALPILPPETYIKYSASLGIKPGGEERDQPAKLGQHYADMFGWKELTDSVAKVYNILSPEEKKDCAIFARNYGQAGAIDYFGEKYGLPKATCGHNSYWYWGPPAWDGKVLIVIGGDEKDYRENFREYYRAGTIDHPYSRSFERHLPIYICKGFKSSIKKIWPRERFVI
jgi:hypothetical protein